MSAIGLWRLTLVNGAIAWINAVISGLLAAYAVIALIGSI